MGFQFAKVITELGERIDVRGQAEGGTGGLMDVGAPPAVELRAAVQQHLHQAHDPGVVDLDARDSGFAGRDRQSKPLKQRKVDVNI